MLPLPDSAIRARSPFGQRPLLVSNLTIRSFQANDWEGVLSILVPARDWEVLP